MYIAAAALTGAGLVPPALGPSGCWGFRFLGVARRDGSSDEFVSVAGAMKARRPPDRGDNEGEIAHDVAEAPRGGVGPRERGSEWPASEVAEREVVKTKEVAAMSTGCASKLTSRHAARSPGPTYAILRSRTFGRQSRRFILGRDRCKWSCP